MQLQKLDKLDEIEATVKQNNKELKLAKDEIKKMKNKNADLVNKVAQLEAKLLVAESAADADKLAKLKKRIIDIQARSTRENLIFYSVEQKETEGVSTEDSIKEIIHDKMGVAEEVRFDRVHHMGSRFTKSGSRRVRPIVAKFESFKVKEKVKYSSKNLSGSNISFSEQFPQEINKERKKLLPLFKKAKEEGRKVKLKVNRLYIDDQLVVLDRDEGAMNE